MFQSKLILSDKFYFLSRLNKYNFLSQLDGSDIRTLIKDQQVPDGIAVDWVAGNIYWTDTGPGNFIFNLAFICFHLCKEEFLSCINPGLMVTA